MKYVSFFLGLCLIVSLARPATGVENLLLNPGFLDEDMDGAFGDSWGSFGAAGFNEFFGPGNPHASFFADTIFNEGGMFQQNISGTTGTTYQFDLINTRIESNWDARLLFGLEYYAADDATKLGETLVEIDTATRLGLPNVDGGGSVNGAVFSMQGTSVAGTAFVRPVARFDTVNETYLNEPQANAFAFNSFLSEAPGVGDEHLKNPGFEDLDGDGSLGDYWSSFGAAGFNAFFGENGHASLFADQPGNSGSVYQQSVLGVEGQAYEFNLTNVRIEANVGADFLFGLEYYDDDDFTKLGETLVTLDTSTTGDGLAFTMMGTAVAGTKYVRPIVSFDNVTSTATEQESLFIFDSLLTEIGTGTDPDFNNDGSVDGIDVDALVMVIVQMSNQGSFDLTGDGIVDGADLTEWLSAAGAINLNSGNSYLMGDANLDGSVDGRDFLDWNGNKFTAVAAWTQGDFNADGIVDGDDFQLWNSNKFTSAGVPLAVPEPVSLFVCLGALLAIVAHRRLRV